jgi:outer membrane protein TolC
MTYQPRVTVWGAKALPILLLLLTAGGCGSPSAKLTPAGESVAAPQAPPPPAAAEPDPSAGETASPEVDEPADGPAPREAAAAKSEVYLPLAEALHMALAGNHDIQIAGYEPLLAEEDVVRAEAVFDPAIFATNNFARTDRPIQSVLDTGLLADDALIEDTWESQAGLRQLLPIGGTVAVFQDFTYLDTNSTFTTPNPQYRGALTAELTQPLLKGAGTRVNRAAIEVANLNVGVSMHAFHREVIDVVTEVAKVYWQLVHDRELVRVSRETVDLAREVVRRERVRKDQGISKDVDVDRALSSLALREADLVRAENRVDATADRLKVLLNAPDVPVEGDAAVLPTDHLAFEPTPVDRNAAVAKALALRPELAAARTAVRISGVRLGVAEHERLPKLDAVLRTSMNGLGGDFGESVGGQYETRNLGWLAGLEFELPLGNREARADYRTRRVEYEQALLEAERVADQAIQEVNLAVRTVAAAHSEVASTRRAVQAAERTLKGEHVRFELNQITNEDLLRAQDILAAAEREHVRALLAYQQALVDLGRAQGTLLEDFGIEILRPRAHGSERPAPYRPRP